MLQQLRWVLQILAGCYRVYCLIDFRRSTYAINKDLLALQRMERRSLSDTTTVVLVIVD